MSEEHWTKWDCHKWNRELFRHYFVVVDGGNDDPVESLCVTADELRHVTGDRTADPEKVQESLLKFVRGSIEGKDRHAKSGKGFEKRMRSSSRSAGHVDGLKIPAGFVYLIVSCLAANQVLEDEESEIAMKTLNDFREILARLLDLEDVLITSDLAETWIDLSDFLKDGFVLRENGMPVQVRPLKLPDPGLEIHIGYSKKLVFPNRRDQKRLALILAQQNLIEENPAVDSVVAAVGSEIRNFSASFKSAFDEFRTLLRMGESLSSLLSNKFWSAVASTCAIDLLSASAHQPTYGLLLDVEDEIPSFYLVANGENLSDKFERIELDENLVAGWSCRLAIADDKSNAVENILANPTGLGSLTALINGGVVPFLRRDDHRFENVSYLKNHENGCILIQNNLRKRLESALEVSPKSQVHQDIFDGWTLIENVNLKSFSNEKLEELELDNVQVLRRRVIKPAIRIQSLYQIGNEYLGRAKLLPKIVAPGFETVSLAVNGIDAKLKQIGDTWSLPFEDFVGSAIVIAKNGNEKSTRTFTFVDIPSSDAFLQPTDASGLMIEVNTGTESYESFLARASNQDVSKISDTVHRTYFGQHQGEFLTSAENSLVEISFFGDEYEVLFGDYETALENLGELNDENAENKSLKRKWRQRLTDIAIQEAVKGNAEVASKLRKLADPKSRRGIKVPAVTGYSSPPTPYEDSATAYELRRVLQAAVGARSLRKKGVPSKIWISMIREIFGVDYREARLIHRGWVESGILDEVISVRSPGSTVFARTPRLEVFESENGFVGGVTGLVMPERFENLRTHADRLGLQASTNLGPSRLVPPHLRVRSSDMDELKVFAQEFRIPLHFLPPEPFGPEMPREQGSRPTRTYFSRKNSPLFSLESNLEVKLFESMKAPLVWSIESEDVKAWTYSAAHSEHLLTAINQSENFIRKSAVDISVKSAFIPLQAARWVTVVSGVPSGPNDSGDYVYRFASPAMLENFKENYQDALQKEVTFWKQQEGVDNA